MQLNFYCSQVVGYHVIANMLRHLVTPPTRLITENLNIMESKNNLKGENPTDLKLLEIDSYRLGDSKVSEETCELKSK